MTHSRIVAQSPKKPVGKAKNVSVYMTVKEHRRLVEISQAVGLSYSAIVRGLIASYSAGEIEPRQLPRLHPTTLTCTAPPP